MSQPRAQRSACLPEIGRARDQRLPHPPSRRVPSRGNAGNGGQLYPYCIIVDMEKNPQTKTTRQNPKRGKASESSYALMEFMADFPDDETCLTWLWKTRYALNDANEAHCPKCEEIRTFKRYGTTQSRQSWTCSACGLHIHPTAGTIFHKSSTSLHLWFYAMYLMTSTRCGISAKQLERELGVTYKTAWRMFTLIRNELMDDADVKLNGAVEMDEMYVGGRPRVADKRGFAEAAKANGTSRQVEAQRWSDKKKTPVFGMVERSREG